MSHFAVVVVTKEYPTKEVLSETLQPFHQFECTGIHDEFVVDVDETENALANYNSHRKSMVQLPSGELVSAYSDQFYRDPTPEESKEIGSLAGTGGNANMSWTSKDWGDDLGYRTKVHHIPADCVEVEKSCNEIMTFSEFLKYWYGMEDDHFVKEGDSTEDLYHYAVIDDAGNVLKFVNRTNPNYKWDWWQVGGRYTGRLSAAYDPEKDERNLEWKYNHSIGAEERVPKWPTQWVEFEGDIIQKSALNFEKLFEAKRGPISAKFVMLSEAIKHCPDFKLWDEIDESDHGKKREIYNSQEAIKALREVDFWLEDKEIALIRDGKRDEYVKAVSSTHIVPFAFVHDGNWYEKGEMGWFGISVGNKEQMNWHDQFMGMIDSLEPTDWLTVVDCHI